MWYRFAGEHKLGDILQAESGAFYRVISFTIEGKPIFRRIDHITRDFPGSLFEPSAQFVKRLQPYRAQSLTDDELQTLAELEEVERMCQKAVDEALQQRVQTTGQSTFGHWKTPAAKLQYEQWMPQLTDVKQKLAEFWQRVNSKMESA